MTRKCRKEQTTLAWTVAECVLFAGVVLGWSWFTITFRRDHYFLSACNLTSNASSALGLSSTTMEPSTDQDAQQAREPVIRQVCRTRKVKKIRAPQDSDSKDNVTRVRRSEERMPNASEDFTSATSFPLPEHAQKLPAPNSSLPEEEEEDCLAQDDLLRLLFALVMLLRDLLLLPLGIFCDKYGTTRTRLLTVLIFVVGTLTMTFTSAGVPWLIMPALTLTGAAGGAVMLTNLQVANLFGRRRNTVVSIFVGATYTGALLPFLMHVLQTVRVNVQTSFMFLTIGIVPMLVSTIAFLPKTRIPWPLPADYGKRRNQSLDEALLRKQKAWQRRVSEGGSGGAGNYGAHSKMNRRQTPDVSPILMQSLYIWSVVWYGVQQLKTVVMETRLIELIHSRDGVDYELWYGGAQFLAISVCPITGLLMDKRRRRQLGVSPVTQQMQNVVPALFLTTGLGLLELILALIDSPVLQIITFFIDVIHKSSALSTTCSFLMHTHFPQQHTGTLLGVTLASASLLSAFQFPLKTYVIRKPGGSLHVIIFLIIVCLICFGHPINVWDHCRKNLIHDCAQESDRNRHDVSTNTQTADVTVSVKNAETLDLVLEEAEPVRSNGSVRHDEDKAGNAEEDDDIIEEDNEDLETGNTDARI